MVVRMIVRAEVGATLLADLVKRIQAGDEVLLIQDEKPVAKMVSAGENDSRSGAVLTFSSIKGHHVLTPDISQEDLAEEMFGR